jgi:hypothetical protein
VVTELYGFLLLSIPEQQKLLQMQVLTSPTFYQFTRLGDILNQRLSNQAEYIFSFLPKQKRLVYHPYQRYNS